MGSRAQGEDLGLQGRCVVAGEVRRVGQRADVDGVRGKDGKHVGIRGDDELSNLICHGCFDSL